jgi:hypothetical protein
MKPAGTLDASGREARYSKYTVIYKKILSASQFVNFFFSQVMAFISIQNEHHVIII